MNTLEVKDTNIERVARTNHVIMADQDGNLPTSIEVLRCGMWITPWHGDFIIKPEDLLEYVENFNKGIGLVSAGIGAPIDFSHNNHLEAAGWMKSLRAEGDVLFADVEWSMSGKDALLGGLYKCFSPEFYPRGRGGWENPEEAGHYVENVLVGGGLTNKPLFSGLAPVMASATATGDGEGNKNVIYIKASERENPMDLNALRAKDANALTDEEKDFLVEHKAELNTDELTKFGLQVEAPAQNNEGDGANGDENKAQEPVSVEDKELAGVMASIKSGEMKVIKASEYNELKAGVDMYKREKAEQAVKAHIARGAIKADQFEETVGRYLSDSTFGAFLDTLPENKIMANEIGKDNGSAEAKSVTERISEKVQEAIKADQKLDIAKATSLVLASDPALAKEYEELTKGVK